MFSLERFVLCLTAGVVKGDAPGPVLAARLGPRGAAFAAPQVVGDHDRNAAPRARLLVTGDRPGGGGFSQGERAVRRAVAFLSEHPRASGATAKALLLTILVGASVSGLAGDAVTGFVAGVGAGGIVAMRADVAHNWKARAIAVLAVSACVFILLRSTTVIALLLAPVLPFTSIGVADHLSERRREREARA